MSFHLHRNSQKRFYEDGATYFITTVTYDRHPFFREPLLAELFIRNSWFAKNLKEFALYGYTVLPDHVHLLVQPLGKANVSEVMRSLKTNFSRDANDILLHRVNRIPSIAGDVAPRRLLQQPRLHTRPMKPYEQHMLTVLPRLYRKFVRKHGLNHDFPFFRWQQSFRDHIIRDERDYRNHLEYIFNNAFKHKLVNNPEDWLPMWVEGMLEPIFR